MSLAQHFSLALIFTRQMWLENIYFWKIRFATRHVCANISRTKRDIRVPETVFYRTRKALELVGTPFRHCSYRCRTVGAESRSKASKTAKKFPIYWFFPEVTWHLWGHVVYRFFRLDGLFKTIQLPNFYLHALRSKLDRSAKFSLKKWGWPHFEAKFSETAYLILFKFSA